MFTQRLWCSGTSELLHCFAVKICSKIVRCCVAYGGCINNTVILPGIDTATNSDVEIHIIGFCMIMTYKCETVLKQECVLG